MNCSTPYGDRRGDAEVGSQLRRCPPQRETSESNRIHEILMQIQRNPDHYISAQMFGVCACPASSSFIRSIRIRYLSGLLIFAVACGAIIFAMNRANSFRHEVDSVGFGIRGSDARPAQRRQPSPDRRPATGAPIRATSWPARRAAMSNGSTRRSSIWTDALAALRPSLSASDRARTAIGIRQRRSVLVGARHRAQSRRVRQRARRSTNRPTARSATRTTSSRSRC